MHVAEDRAQEAQDLSDHRRAPVVRLWLGLLVVRLGLGLGGLGLDPARLERLRAEGVIA